MSSELFRTNWSRVTPRPTSPRTLPYKCEASGCLGNRGPCRVSLRDGPWHRRGRIKMNKKIKQHSELVCIICRGAGQVPVIPKLLFLQRKTVGWSQFLRSASPKYRSVVLRCFHYLCVSSELTYSVVFLKSIHLVLSRLHSVLKSLCNNGFDELILCFSNTYQKHHG